MPKVFLSPPPDYQKPSTCSSVGSWILQSFFKASEIALRHAEDASIPDAGQSRVATNSVAQNVQQPFQSGWLYS